MSYLLYFSISHYGKKRITLKLDRNDLLTKAYRGFERNESKLSLLMGERLPYSRILTEVKFTHHKIHPFKIIFVVYSQCCVPIAIICL